MDRLRERGAAIGWIWRMLFRVCNACMAFAVQAFLILVTGAPVVDAWGKQDQKTYAAAFDTLTVLDCGMSLFIVCILFLWKLNDDDAWMADIARIVTGTFCFQTGLLAALRFYIASRYNHSLPSLGLDDPFLELAAFMWGIGGTLYGLFVLLFPDKHFPSAHD